MTTITAWGVPKVLGRDNLRVITAIAMAVLVLSGVLAPLGAPVVSAEEQPAYSPADTLSWPRRLNPRNAVRLPLTSFDGRLAANVYLIRETVSVAIYDPSSNRLYSGGDAGPIASASLAKVLMAIIALQQLEDQRAGDDEFRLMRSLIHPTIAYSDNENANLIWTLIGGQQAVADFAEANGLTGFSAPHPWDWGKTSAEAADWALLFAMLGSGLLLNASNTAALLAMMDAVIEDHRWGVLGQRPDSVSYGKNGWYMDDEDEFVWRVNSAGFVSIAEDGLGNTPRVVVVLTRYPAEAGMGYGVHLTTRITDDIITCTHLQNTRTTLSLRSGSCTSDRETAMLMDRARRIW